MVFITLMRFLLCDLVLYSFLLLMRYSLLFFFHLRMFDGVCFQYSQVFVSFLFSMRSNFFLDLVDLFHLSFVVFNFITSMVHFSMQNSIPISLLYILTAIISNSFSFLANRLMSTLHIRWLVLLLLLLIRVFHISVSWWSFTGDWVTASLLKSPGLFSVFWPFSIMLLFGWSPLSRQLLNLPGPLRIL